jgi:hypothetical protein
MKREHRVKIKLQTTNIWDLNSRVNEVGTIREWVKEQCNWDEERFEIKFHSMASVLDIWFENEQDAMMCALRWGQC